MTLQPNTPDAARTGTQDAQAPAATPATMKAVVQAGYSDDLAAVLRLQSVPTPVPASGEVLIRVAASGVDRGTWHLATGRPYLVRLGYGLRTPRQPIPGMDLAGTVVAIGPGVSDFAVGDEVFGSSTAAYAEYATAPVTSIAKRPATLSVAEAAALPTSGSTALEAVRDHVKLVAGEKVLITGASGGVGVYAVQLAVAAGAHVVGVASAAKAEGVRELGAEQVIDYRSQPITAAGGGFDAIIDIAGNTPLRTLRSMLTPTGRLVIVGGEHGGSVLGGNDRQARAMVLSRFSRQSLTGMFSRTTAATLASLTQAVQGGQLRDVVSARYPMAQAGRALNDLASGAITGKAVVRTVD